MGDGAQDLLVHADDGLQRQVIHHHIGGVDQEIVQGQTDDRHTDSAGNGTPQGTAAALAALIDDTGNDHEHRAQQEIGQFAHAGAAAERQMQDVLYQLDGGTVNRAQREGAQQGRQVGDIQLDKGRDQRGNGKFNELQHEGYCRQHSCHGQMVGFLFLRHKKRLLFDDVTPLEAIVSQGARIKKEHYEKCRTRLLSSRLYCRYRNRTDSCSPAGSLADYTAGGEFRPAPKTNDPVVFVCYDTTNGDKRQELFAKSFVLFR